MATTAQLPASVPANDFSRLDRAEERGRTDARRDARRGEAAYNPYRVGTVLWDAYNHAYEAERRR